MMIRALAIALLFLTAPSATAEDLRLAWPVDCQQGQTCWIQQYPDHDASAGAADYLCGSQSYDGHDGTDIRLRTTQDQAAVWAAAAGVVKGIRDGVPDRLVKTEADVQAVKDIECGNGVLLAHEGGWETQYCHLREGSVAVRVGDAVSVGQKLGMIGYSGEAAFPHVHLSLRKDGKKIDPFAGAVTDACAAPDVSLWATTPSYENGTVLQLGFANSPVDVETLETGGQPLPDLTRNAPALVAFTWLINLQKNDVIDVALAGPRGEVARNTITLDRSKAQYLLFAGKKRPAEGWPPGEYRAIVTITNNGKERMAQSRTARLE